MMIFSGFFDLQVNGRMNIDFSKGNLTTNEILSVAQCQWENGVVAFAPTLVSKPIEVMLEAITSIVRAREEDERLRNSIPGIFLEGPWISPEDGPRGAHDKDSVRVPDWKEFQKLQQTARGLIKIVNVAPEIPGAIDFMTRLANTEVIVSIGHTAATNEQIDEAIKAGAKLSSHLGNGNFAKMPRNDNNILYQLTRPELTASFIVDTFHLSPYVVDAYMRLKLSYGGAKTFILVSDSAPIAGMPPGEYTWNKQKVELQSDGKVILAGTPYLAGSSLNLKKAVENIIGLTSASYMKAIHFFASSNPANLLLSPEKNLTRKRYEVTAEMSSRKINIFKTTVMGEVVYET